MSENEAPAAEAPKAEKPAKAPKVVQNGVTKPADPNSKTGRVWAIADEISRLHKRPATRKEVIEAGEAEGMSRGTLATQYGHWCRFHGIQAAPKAAPAEPAQTPDQPAPESAPEPAKAK